MLQTADFKPFYTSGEEDEPSGFLFEGLKNSLRFDLGLGYFRSTGFSCLALGFASFIKRGGSMRFIINDSLVEKDKAAILQGLRDLPDEAYEQTLLNDLNKLTETLTKRNKHFFHCLSWLISSGKLQMIAVVPKKHKVGIVHHKFGIFSDSKENQAAFNGSLNFSQYALQYNVESIWCEYSWEAQGLARVRINEMIRLFENTWSGNSNSVRTIQLEAVKTAIHRKFPQKTYQELVDMECELAKEVIEFPGTSPDFREKMKKILQQLQDSTTTAVSVQQPRSMWTHQEEAVKLFFQHEKGILNMATGTGKTHTALRICKILIEKDLIDSIIIACDGVDLLQQWYKEIRKMVAHEAQDWAIPRQYGGFREGGIFRTDPYHKILLVSRQKVNTAIGRFTPAMANRTLLIHDEVHRLGSQGSQEKLSGLSDDIRFRLGLSATPEREYDEEGTAFVFEHIGPVIFEFTLEDAIRKGILAPFNYIPLEYQLTANDKANLQQVWKRESAAKKAGRPMTQEQLWMEISRVYKTAEGKISVFRNFIDRQPDILKKCIIFVETKEFGEQVLDLVHAHSRDFHTYFSEDDSAVLDRFSKGEIECLLTCHRLSEGIDIRSLQNVILLSSARARLETIQRIGRCLRRDPKDPGKVATVVDFIRHNNKEEKNDINPDEARAAFLSRLSAIKPEN